MRTLADVIHEFPAEFEAGLSAAQVAESRQRHGRNALTPAPRVPIWRQFLAKFYEPIIRILLAALLLKVVIDLFESSVAAGLLALAVVGAVAAGGFVRSWRPLLPALAFAAGILLVLFSVLMGNPSYDGFAVMLAVALATGVAFAAEYKSDREFEILNAAKDAIQVKVYRDGAFHTIPLDEVVVGDRVALAMGDEVPADGRILHATEFWIDQSLMTGESEPSRKSAAPADDAGYGLDHPGCVYRGTQVVDGVGQIVVTEVGDATMLGGIARSLAGADHGAEQRVRDKLSIAKNLTPLQVKLQRLAEQISRVGYIAAVTIFFALVIHGWITGDLHWPASAADFRHVAERLLHYFVIMVIIIVVAVPEGLPMSVTISLALAMRKMTRANSLVRQLVACETIGSATVICTDKTGTLTQNQMRVVEIHVGELALPAHGSSADARAALEWIVLNAAVNSTAELEEKNGRTIVVGNSTEGALLRWLTERGIDYRALRRQYPEIYQVLFSSERKRMTTVIERDGRLIALVKGAPEMLLERSAAVLEFDGRPRPMDAADRRTFEARLTAAAEQSIRTLGFALMELPPDTPRDEAGIQAIRDRLDRELTLIGFVAIRDPLRPDVAEAVAQCRSAGIDVKMVTGDVVTTARAIAAEIGLIDSPQAVVLASHEFSAMSDAAAADVLPRLRVLARAKPLDKYRLVELLQARGEVVAMTGDGTNDAPSLKKADVGLAMGIAGTEVAKEASKIVLLDDAFSTIVRAVHWGRALFENIQRFVQFQLTINVSALVIAFLAPFLGFGEPPFTVLQFLWINIIMDTFAAIALCSEPPRPGLMREPPKRRDQSIVTPAMMRTILSTAAFFVIVMLTLLMAMKGPPERPGWFAGEGPVSKRFELFTVRQATIFFTTYVFFQVWNMINCRSLTPDISGWTGIFGNPTFWLIAGLIVAGQVAIVNFGGPVFHTAPLSWTDWLCIVVGTSTVLAVGEALRFCERRRAARGF